MSILGEAVSNGLVSSVVAQTITYADGVWVINEHAGRFAYFPAENKIISIVSNTANTLVHNDLTYTPADGSLYVIHEASSAAQALAAVVTLPTSAVTVPVLGSPANTRLSDLLNWTSARGLINGGGLITDNLDGSVAVSAGSGIIKAIDTEGEINYFTDWLAVASLALTDASVNYIYVDYNAGIPTIISTIIERDADVHTSILLGKVYRQGIIIHINAEVKQRIDDAMLHTINRLSETRPFEHASGAAISETGVLNFAISAGAFWEGLNRFTTVVFDSSGVDTFNYVYSDGAGGFTQILAQAAIDNLQYDDGSGVLATLANNKYGVHWVFLTTDSHVAVVYGEGSYSLNEAENANVPAALHPAISMHARVIGKIIVKKSSIVFTSIESAFDAAFETASPTDHENLTGLLGGAVNDHYHLTLAEYGMLPAVPITDLSVGGPHVLTVGQSGYISFIGITNTVFGQFNISCSPGEVYELNILTEPTVSGTTQSIEYLFNGVRYAAGVLAHNMHAQNTALAASAILSDAVIISVAAYQNGIIHMQVHVESSGGVGRSRVLSSFDGNNPATNYIGVAGGSLISAATAHNLLGALAMNLVGVTLDAKVTIRRLR